jgi:hypothetical protein
MARGDAVRHPAQQWDFQCADLSADKGWQQCVKQAFGASEEAWEAIVSEPRTRTTRQHQLKVGLATGTHDGKVLEQWQYELTGGARLRYLIDDDTKTVWLKQASTGHPKDSERVKGGRKRSPGRR